MSTEDQIDYDKTDLKPEMLLSIY